MKPLFQSILSMAATIGLSSVALAQSAVTAPVEQHDVKAAVKPAPVHVDADKTPKPAAVKHEVHSKVNDTKAKANTAAVEHKAAAPTVGSVK
ncbi:MAG: hypothetical protein RL701_7783 [Pseudomonadota bacterium]|jgi:hypothetical protein